MVTYKPQSEFDNETNSVWQNLILKTYSEHEFESNPRGMRVLEVLNGSYTVPMPAYISLIKRNINKKFMFAEAAWIISGSNRLSDLTKTMKMYANFSDDGVFLRGAYGPKVVDQLPYIVDTLVNDNDSRQAVMTIWRERPAPSKDIPCTVAAQFFIRDKKLYAIFTMRSNDAILGVTYDVFSFSMIAKSVQLLLRARGVLCELGTLTVNAGSLHIYEQHFKNIYQWSTTTEVDTDLEVTVNSLRWVDTYEELINKLQELSN